MSAMCHHCDPHDATAPQMRKALWAALIINISMFAVEFSSGWLSGSVGLQADAVDFFGDAANYALSLAVLGMALRWRTHVALLKGLTMGLFGLWVAGNIIYHWVAGTVPSYAVMGGVAVLALAANVVCAVMLYKFRGTDANMASVWICSRNDAISNIAIMIAALGVWGSGSGVADLVVAAFIGGLALYGSYEVLRRVKDEYATPLTQTQPGAGD